MLPLVYTSSTFLRGSLNRIESLRQRILLTPLSPKTELRLRWEAKVNRTYWACHFDGNSLKKDQVIKILSAHAPKPSSQDARVVSYKSALDYLLGNWLVNPDAVTPQVVWTLYEILGSGSRRRDLEATWGTIEAPVKQLLEYLQTKSESPIIQAAIAQIELVSAAPDDLITVKVAQMVSYLFLYKAGYDFRGLLVLEENPQNGPVALGQMVGRCLKIGNLNAALESFVDGLVAQLEKIASGLETFRPQTDLPASFFELSDRQKETLANLDQPGATITNKKVQKLFKISQITASRDLAKLANLGLLITHGKGRAVYYTRV